MDIVSYVLGKNGGIGKDIVSSLMGRGGGGGYKGLSFTALTAGSTVNLTKTDDSSWPIDWTGKYSIDGNSWSDYTFGTTITLANIGDKIYFEGTLTSQITNQYAYMQFTMAGSIAASGNIMSLVCGSDFESATEIPTQYCFHNLFRNCGSLVTPPELPAITLKNNCYHDMFTSSGITTAPELPARTLANSCCSYMFSYCNSLLTPPELPALKLDRNCYDHMFYGSGITTSPELLAVELANACYSYMFGSCSSLVAAKRLPATELFNECYYYMFYGCTSLEVIPRLPALVLKDYCYYGIFDRCTKVKVSETQEGEYVNEYRIPVEGTGTDSYRALWSVFRYTGGTYTGDAAINTTYYTSNEVV